MVKIDLKRDIPGNICACITALLMAMALAFYAPAVLRNFSPLVVAFGVVAILIYLLGILFDLKGADVLVGAALTAFCFGYFLIGRLESINLIQVNLSDINSYFYIDITLFAAALILSLITAVVKKTGR